MNIKDLIIYEDDDIVVLNKPAGLLSIPDREGKDISLKKILRQKYPDIFVVHRLDRDTSGLILFAKNEQAHKFISNQFEKREAGKIYQGLVLGSLLDKKGTLDAAIAEHPVKKGTMIVHRKGKDAITDYEVMNDFGKFSWMKFRIYTGRTHQIRVHMKHIGHPIACDPVYGDGQGIFVSSLKSKYNLSRNEMEEKPLLSRLALHAFSLALTWPGGQLRTFEALLPKDLKAVLQQLSKNKKGSL